jgi:hypothetical protein
MLKSLVVAGVVSVAAVAHAQPACPEAGQVRSQELISLLTGGFAGDINPGDSFGDAVVELGDVDGDGVADLAVAAPLHDEPGLAEAGAIFVLLMNAEGTVRETTEITNTDLPSVSVGIGPRFGNGLAALGDLDGDGTPDLAAGLPGLDISGRAQDSGAVDILFLNPDGSVKRRQRIAEGLGNFEVNTEITRFGFRLGNIGDLDGDGFPELAVGAPRTVIDGLTDVGALYVLFLLPDGTIKADVRLAPGENGFDVPVGFNDGLGFDNAIVPLGDVNDDGLDEIAIGLIRFELGTAFVLSMNPDGTVASSTRLTLEGFPGVPPFVPFNGFGAAVEPVGDLDNDGVIDVAIAQPYPEGTSGSAPGVVYILYLNADLTIKAFSVIGQGEGGFNGPITADVDFGRSLALLPDLDGDGFRSLAIGASGGFDGTTEGGVWIVELDDCQTAPTVTSQPGSVAVDAGDAIVLSAAASGDGVLAYQWTLDGQPLIDGPVVTGSMTPSLSINPVRSLDAGVYAVTVSNAFGSATSEPAFVAVRSFSECRGDFDGDGDVDGEDLGLFGLQFGRTDCQD